jgi:hypothetical protein
MTGRDGGFGLTVLTPEQQVAATLARDARRVRLLTWATVLLWAAAVAGVVWLLVVFKMQVIPRLEVTQAAGERVARQQDRKQAPDPEDVRKLQGWTTSLGMAATVGAAILAAIVGLLALACLGTVLLVFATRRTTLRQIQVSLADISAQLADLRQRTATGAPPSG